MVRVPRRLLSLCLATVMVAGVAPAAAPAALVQAADPAWTLPTVPPKCTTAQTTSGDVAGCVITLGPGLPETRGWPKPPFPDPENPTVVPWVDLALGASGAAVSEVQSALVAAGAVVSVDGQFGLQTQAAVMAFQTSHALPATGVVDTATAAALGVQKTTGGTFPPTGWKWLGWGYNASPALLDWEALLTSNAAQIGSMRPGSLRAFADALPLFEGFYAEIQANGYKITDGGTYVFRCTSSTRKDCAGLTRAALSNHAYGLASDINVAKNPQKTYYGINGASACQTPVVTDLPRWVVQTAEKWGLYWGGYGWSSGCSSPSQVKASVTRDAMHFEYDGTVDQARAILRHNVGPGACIQVVDENGVQTERCMVRTDTPAANTRIAIDTRAPAGATAALVNIATTGALHNGYITAENCAARPTGPRQWANGNVRVGRTGSATAIVALDETGRFCLFQSAAFHTVVDVQGYFLPSAIAPSGNLFTPVTPIRALDTKSSPFCASDSTCFGWGPVAAGAEVVSTAASSLIAVASVANITVVGPTLPGYITADSCADLLPGPQTRSNGNYSAGDIAVTNLGVVPSSTTEQGVQFCTYSSRQVDERVDVTGFFASADQGGLGYTALAPTRLVDTRECWTDPVNGVQRCGAINGPGAIVRIRAPAGASAVVVNLAAVDTRAPGLVTPSSCAVVATGGVASPSVQALVGGTTANIAVVPVDTDGMFCVTLSSTMHLVVDLVGTFSPTGDLRFVPVSPVRLHDSRPPA